MTPQLILLIEDKIEEKWSPEQISGWLGNEIHTTVSHETIYRHIWHDKRLGGSLHSHLRRKGKAYQSRAESQAGRGHIKNRVSIDERQTSFTVSTRIFDKQAATVTAATISLLMPYKDAVLTITADNGKEFAYHEQVTKSLSAPVYFADPYCSW